MKRLAGALKPPLVVADEAHHVALRRVGRVVPRRRHYPLRRASIFIGRQLAGGDQLAKGQLGHRRPLPGVWVQDREGRLRRRHEKKAEESESGGQETGEKL
jgi:hypothetical protein